MKADRRSGATDGSWPRTEGSRIASRRCPRVTVRWEFVQAPLPSGPRRFSASSARSIAAGSIPPESTHPAIPHMSRGEGVHQPCDGQGADDQREEELDEEDGALPLLAPPQEREEEGDQERVQRHDQEVVGRDEGGEKHHFLPVAMS